MTNKGRAWFEGLRRHIGRCRDRVPITPRDRLSDDDEWECRIVGSTIVNWLENLGPSLLQERSVLCKLLQVESDPFIVITSTMPGLVAADEIVGGDNERIVYVFDSEFADWTATHPDPGYKWHVHMLSRFQQAMTPHFRDRAVAAYPDVDGAVLRQHSEGTMWGEHAGRGVDHLWKWGDGKPELLEEAFGHWDA
jgi:hypothetical protein